MNPYRTLFIALVLALATTTLQAQAEKPPIPTADEVLARMQENLNLTPQQVAEIEPILGNNMIEAQLLRDAIREAATRQERFEFFKQLRELQRDTREQIGLILTEEQKATAREIIQEKLRSSPRGRALMESRQFRGFEE